AIRAQGGAASRVGRGLLRRGDRAGRGRRPDLLPERRRLPDAEPQGPGGARPALFRCDGEVRRLSQAAGWVSVASELRWRRADRSTRNPPHARAVNLRAPTCAHGGLRVDQTPLKQEARGPRCPPYGAAIAAPSTLTR